MTTPDLVELEKLARAYLDKKANAWGTEAFAKACRDFRDASGPQAVLSLLTRLKEAERELAEANENWIDENGLAWSRPTAHAYAMVCRVKDKWQLAAEAAEAINRDLAENLQVFLENPLSQVSVGRNPTAADKLLAKARAALSPIQPKSGEVG